MPLCWIIQKANTRSIIKSLLQTKQKNYHFCSSSMTFFPSFHFQVTCLSPSNIFFNFSNFLQPSPGKQKVKKFEKKNNNPCCFSIRLYKHLLFDLARIDSYNSTTKLKRTNKLRKGTGSVETRDKVKSQVIRKSLCVENFLSHSLLYLVSDSGFLRKLFIILHLEIDDQVHFQSQSLLQVWRQNSSLFLHEIQKHKKFILEKKEVWHEEKDIKVITLLQA